MKNQNRGTEIFEKTPRKGAGYLGPNFKQKVCGMLPTLKDAERTLDKKY